MLISCTHKGFSASSIISGLILDITKMTRKFFCNRKVISMTINNHLFTYILFKLRVPCFPEFWHFNANACKRTSTGNKNGNNININKFFIT